MKKKKNVVFMNVIVVILALFVILPMMTLLIWIFTEVRFLELSAFPAQEKVRSVPSFHVSMT